MGFNSMIIFGTVVLTVMLVVSAAPPSDVKELRTTSTQQDKALKPDKTSDVEPHVEKQILKSSAAAGSVIPDNKEKSLKAKSLASKEEALKSSETAAFVYSWGHHYPYLPYNYYYNYPYYYL